MDHDVVPIGASCVGLVLSALGHEPRIALQMTQMTSGHTVGPVGRLKKRTGAVREKGEVARNMIVMAMCSGLQFIAVHGIIARFLKVQGQTDFN